MKKTEPAVKKVAQERMQIRYQEIVSEAEQQIDDGQKELDDGKAELQSEKDSAYAKLRQSKNTLDQKSA